MKGFTLRERVASIVLEAAGHVMRYEDALRAADRILALLDAPAGEPDAWLVEVEVKPGVWERDGVGNHSEEAAIMHAKMHAGDLPYRIVPLYRRPEAPARRARIEAYRDAAELAQGYHDGNHFDDGHSEGMRTAGRSIAFLLRQRADELERDA